MPAHLALNVLDPRSLLASFALLDGSELLLDGSGPTAFRSPATSVEAIRNRRARP